MKHTGLIILLIIASKLCISQTIKNYKGDFGNGKASYTYYDNEDYERVFHGSFEYTSKSPALIKGIVYTSSTKVNGNFEKGEKTGRWSLNTNVLDDNDNVLKNTKVDGKYINGKPTGVWQIVYINTNTGDTTNSKIKYSNDGNLKEFQADKIDGSFNDNGKFDGKWRGVYWNNQDEKMERVYEFNNGIVLKCITREFETGEITDRYDITALVNDFYSNYNQELNYSHINGKFYTLEEVNFTQNSYLNPEEDYVHNLLSILINWLPEPFYWINGRDENKSYSFENIIKEISKDELIALYNKSNKSDKLIDSLILAQENINQQRILEEKQKEQQELEIKKEKQERNQRHADLLLKYGSAYTFTRSEYESKSKNKAYEILLQDFFKCDGEGYELSQCIEGKLKEKGININSRIQNEDTFNELVRIDSFILKVKNALENLDKESEKQLKKAKNTQEVKHILSL
ncbi:MAG: hypothetical protein KQH79_14105 [Bacteroidetes bacterium]|nr:hypothetical protein [Bacteroidota bacterium]